MLDPAGRVATWNAGAQADQGILAGRGHRQAHLDLLHARRSGGCRKPQTLLDAALADGRVEDEGWRVRKDGTRFWADVVITPLRDPAGQLEGFAKVTRDLTLAKEGGAKLQRGRRESPGDALQHRRCGARHRRAAPGSRGSIRSPSA